MEAEETHSKTEQQTPVDNEHIKMIRSPHTEDLVDHYWGSINYIFSLIKASEIKAGLILSFYGILLNFIYQKIDVSNAFQENILFFVLCFIWFVSTFYSVYCCVRCFMPKIEGTYDKNIFFFRDVITKFGSIHEFSKTFYKISLDEEELFEHMGQQIYIISKIASAKFNYVKQALRFLGIGLASLLCIVIYHFFIKLVLVHLDNL